MRRETGNVFSSASFLPAVFLKGFINATEIVQTKQGSVDEKTAVFCIASPQPSGSESERNPEDRRITPSIYTPSLGET
ncbi:Gametogenetin [Clarias magur]|uniref:Gametogenetin n=1 Tax=Clarias magur TaxID=1594786 RepID=A0A8J4U4S0_CLAMG|nr:Gametogenetin [Clarias magur]